MKRIKPLILPVLVFLSLIFHALSPQSAQARDLTQRLGLGFADQWANSNSNRPVPVLSAKYALSRQIAISGVAGAALTDDENAYTLGAKFYRTVIDEPLSHFYFGGGAAMLKGDPAGGSDTGFEMRAFLGAEFFFQGIESIGFSFEAGVSAASFGDGFNTNLTGDILGAGIHFYL